MDLYKIINSQSVGNYLKEINYSFSSLQAAFLIWHSRRLTIKEKHAMWEELIATMPDAPIEARPNTVPQASLHEFLKQYMALENKLIERFYAAEPDTFYSYDFYCKDDHCWCEDNGFYKTAEDCFRELQKESSDLEIQLVKLKKDYLNTQNESLRLYMTFDREVFEIDARGILSEEEWKLHEDVFGGFWFEFPLPFKKGDIIQPANCPYDIAIHTHDEDRAILLEDDLIISDRMRELHRQSGDISDMVVWGIFCGSDGKFYHECEWTTLDFELQYKPLREEEQPMIPMSNYLKGKIPIDLLCNAYHIILSEWQTTDSRRYLNVIDEYLQLAGLVEI